MIQLDILAVGNLIRNEDGSILKADSTSVLVRSGDRIIVVDPSTKYLRPAVRTSFKQIGVFPKDVDTVILAHAHSDHTENLDLYRNAEVIIHSGSDAEIPGAKVVNGEEIRICQGVRMVHTPGHCPEHCSVFVDSDRHYVIAGDAVPLEDNLRKMIPPRLNTDPDLALQSIKNIRDYADVVIPGHGFPFMTDR
jgi:glyoxylase-like metal-dependent hydrolase (beta-lactamase superfamily II)